MVKRKTEEEFKKEVYELVGSEFTFLEPYVRSNVKIKVLHNKCGNVFYITPNNFLRRHSCKFCSGNLAKQKTTEQFKEEVFNLVGDEYTVMGEYINRVTYIKIKHNLCGTVYKIRPHNFLSGSRCTTCLYNSLKLTKKEVDKRILEHLGDSYELVSDYVNLQKKATLYHKKCGTYFKVRLDDVFIKNSGCPKCVQSRGEEYIESFLKEKNIRYTRQKRFNGLRDIRPLSYDFYLYDMGILIEYQGEQHFKPKEFSKSTSKKDAILKLELQKKHDKMKMDFASKNNLTLLCPTFKFNSYSKVYNYLENVLYKK